MTDHEMRTLSVRSEISSVTAAEAYQLKCVNE